MCFVYYVKIMSKLCVLECLIICMRVCVCVILGMQGKGKEHVILK